MKYAIALLFVPLTAFAELKKVDYKEAGVETQQERQPASPGLTEAQTTQMMETLKKAQKYREEEKKYLDELENDL